jgi:hypothetical protein
MYSISSCEYCWKKINLIQKSEKTHFHASSLGNELINSYLELSHVPQLEEHKIVLPKPMLMSHHPLKLQVTTTIIIIINILG